MQDESAARKYIKWNASPKIWIEFACVCSFSLFCLLTCLLRLLLEMRAHDRARIYSIYIVLYHFIHYYHIAMRACICAKIFVSGTIEIKKQQQQQRRRQQQCKPTWRCAIRNVTISFAHSLPYAYPFSFTPLHSVLCVECVCVCKHN